MLLHDIRDSYSAQTTLGKMYIDKVYFSETLADTVRPYGIKVKGDTAIPANTMETLYKVELRNSDRFGDTIVIYTRKIEEKGKQTKYYLDYGGISFMYILAHGGNDHGDTGGCVLVAKNRLNKDMIQGTMKKELYAKAKEAIDKGEDVFMKVTNTHQPQ